MRRIIFLVLLVTFAYLAKSQTYYSPMDDSHCIKKASIWKGEEWESSYMWYPGQLAAYQQAYHRKMSKLRCVNVGYPGHFNPCKTVTYFRCKQNWGNAPLEYRCTGKSSQEIVGEWLVIKVETNNDLPTLISHIPTNLWQTSLDGKAWNMAETDNRFCHPDLLPTSQIDDIYATEARQVIALRNSRRETDILYLGKNGTILLDFFHLEIGNIRMKVSGNAHLKFKVGESVEEVLCNDTTQYEQYPLPIVEVTGTNQEITLPERALRYLSITTDAPCQLTIPTFEMKIWPVRQQLEFACSNDTINALFQAGIATLHTSMHNFHLDGIKRDYLPWALDAVLSSIGSNYVFGDRQVARNDLSIALMPPSPSEHDWGIVDYPLHALIGLEAYEQRFGNDGTADMFRGRIIAQMQLYMSHQDDSGFISAPAESSGFIPGWSNQNGPDSKGTATYPQIILYKNFLIAARLAKRWDEKQLVHLYLQKARLLKKNIIKCFWDEKQHAFINGMTVDGKKDIRISHYTQYWAILADLYPKEHYPILYNKVVPALKGYFSNISYDRGYEAMAIIKTGRLDVLKSLLVKVWYDWLLQGNTRFPENFSYLSDKEQQLSFYNRPFGLSLCHGANGVPPIVLAMNGILGYSYVSDGHYRIKPNLMGMKWAKGKIPVKEGVITIEIHAGKKPFVTYPKGCQVDIN